VKASGLISHDSSENAILMDTAKFEHCLRLAKLFAGSRLVPEHYRGNLEDCFIAIYQATRMRTDVMFYMQNTYIVRGKLAMEGKMAVALINNRGPFVGPLRFEYEGEGDDRRCRAWAVDRETGDTIYGTWVTWDMVVAEGWNEPKRGQASKWMTMPEQMFAYRSGVFFGRAYCPDILMGMLTKEEADDLVASGQLSEEAESRRKADDLSARILAAEKSIQDAPRQLSAAQAPEATGGGRATEQREPVPNKPTATTGEQPKAAAEPQPDVAGVISKMQAETEQCSECQTREEALRCTQAVRAKYQEATEPWPAPAKEQFAQAYMQSVDVVNKAFKEQEQPAEPVQDKPEGDPPAPAIGSPKLFP
jgi:hypothetical protein